MAHNCFFYLVALFRIMQGNTFQTSGIWSVIRGLVQIPVRPLPSTTPVRGGGSWKGPSSPWLCSPPRQEARPSLPCGSVFPSPLEAPYRSVLVLWPPGPSPPLPPSCPLWGEEAGQADEGRGPSLPAPGEERLGSRLSVPAGPTSALSSPVGAAAWMLPAEPRFGQSFLFVITPWPSHRSCL